MSDVARLGLVWRHVALAGAAAGLGLSPHATVPPIPRWLLALLTAALIASRPRRSCGGAGVWLALVLAVAVLAGGLLGAERLRAIESGALRGAPGTTVSAAGVVVSPPRLGTEGERFAIDTKRGRVAVEAPPHTGMRLGQALQVEGILREPGDWERQLVERLGAVQVLRARAIKPRHGRRGGFAGALDLVRSRAERALTQGTGDSSAALLRGFVLGQDDLIAEPVREEFRRSGLAHVLAVSGQNVMLLALLAAPLLALAGVPLRARLIAIVAVIAIYVPVAGAGPSIQRAGVMGAAGIIAALASRPASRWYALLLAAALTLAVDPRAVSDIGWQLSFAAVAGLLVLARPLADRLGAWRGSSLRRALLEGLAMTLAATIATAPLAAHHFGTLSLTAIPANLLALPAIAPAMWLGMLSAALGQLPWAPVEPLTFLGGLCAGYVGWVAQLFGAPAAQLELTPPSTAVTVALTISLSVAISLACAAFARRGELRLAWRGRGGSRATAMGLVCVTAAAVLLPGARNGSADSTPPDLRVRVLDVGQGDSILLEPVGAGPILVDTGPPGGGALERIRELGFERLAAIAITHDQLDHSGALPALLASLDVERLIAPPGGLPAYCRATGACPPVERLRAGMTLRHSGLSLAALWPPARSAPSADPNARSLVLRASAGRFDALLTGDAEAELASYPAGPVELLKVAHHGSEDAGLPRLLERTRPELAAISAGSGNPHGHPAGPTLLALGSANVAALRTDRHGEIVVTVRGSHWLVE